MFCLAVDCGHLTINNGQVSAPSGTTFMMTATYTCDDGYTPTGSNNSTCGSDGGWSPNATTCNRKYFEKSKPKLCH